MNVNHVRNALHKYDLEKEYIESIKSNNYNISFKIKNDVAGKMIFKDNNNIFAELTFEYIAAYNCDTRVWVWAWSMPELKGPQNFFITYVTKHVFDISNEYSKTVLLNSRGIIEDPLQIDINLALCGDLMKNNLFFPYREKGSNIVYYLILTDRREVSIAFGYIPEKL